MYLDSCAHLVRPCRRPVENLWIEGTTGGRKIGVPRFASRKRASEARDQIAKEARAEKAANRAAARAAITFKEAASRVIASREAGWRNAKHAAQWTATIALRILDLLERSAGIRVEWIGPLRFDQTKAFFRKHAGRKRNWSEIFHPTEIRRLIAQRSSEVTRGEKHSSALNATQSSGKIPSRVSVTRSAQENSPAFFAPHHRNSSSESRRRFRDDPALVVRPSLQQP